MIRINSVVPEFSLLGLSTLRAQRVHSRQWVVWLGSMRARLIMTARSKCYYHYNEHHLASGLEFHKEEYKVRNCSVVKMDTWHLTVLASDRLAASLLVWRGYTAILLLFSPNAKFVMLFSPRYKGLSSPPSWAGNQNSMDEGRVSPTTREKSWSYLPL